MIVNEVYFMTKKDDISGKRTMMLSLIGRWKESGMSQVDFVRVHQVRLAKFRYWVNQQRKGLQDCPVIIKLNVFRNRS